MAKKLKISSHLPGVHNLMTQGNLPHPSTSPFIRLHQLQKNKERFLKEKDRLFRRLAQINKQVPGIEQEQGRLFSLVEDEIQSNVAGEVTAEVTSEKGGKRKKTVVGY